MLQKFDLNRNPYIGVFCRVNENLLVAPYNALSGQLERIANALEVDIVQFSVGSSTLIGSLVCMNSNGALLANLAAKSEVKKLGERLKTEILPDRLNAAGNNILANDNGALINPDYSRKAVECIEDVLGVEVVRGTVAGMNIVGAFAVATNKGALCHPHATETELKAIEEVLQVPTMIGTVNYGAPVIGACILANSKGAVVGTPTTTVELGRVEEALGLY